MTNPSIFVTQLPLEKIDLLKNSLEEKDFTFSNPPHTIFSAKKSGISCTLYSSLKLVVQGKEMPAFVEFFLEPEILETFTFGKKTLLSKLPSHIGVDESGKGDFFGPLCIASIYVEEKEMEWLHEQGVQDSKKIKDAKVEVLAKKIREKFPHHIIRISPKRYNELYQEFHNLNHLLAWGHASVIEKLVKRTGCQTVLIDQFANESVVYNALKQKDVEGLTLYQQHRAEEDIVVGAASVLARAGFLQGLKNLSEAYSMPFPKGASQQTIEAGKKFIQNFGKDELNLVAKLHFKTLDRILENR